MTRTAVSMSLLSGPYACCCRSPAADEFTLTANKLSFSLRYLTGARDGNARRCGRKSRPTPRELRH